MSSLAHESSVSIVIPVRNGERYLGEAIASLHTQTRPPLEILVVDDGSTDASAALAAALPGVVVLQNRGDGAAAARNTGAGHARGRFLGFLDADDLATEYRLELQAELLEADSTLGGVVGAMERFVSPDYDAAALGRAPTGSFAAGEIAYLPSALLVRRSEFAATGGFADDLAAGEGVDWFARARAQMMIAALDVVVLRRRVHQHNYSRERSTLHRGYLDAARLAVQRHRAGS
jgi:glycosyltransferase involved in cell wall biosynthesis